MSRRVFFGKTGLLAGRPAGLRRHDHRGRHLQHHFGRGRPPGPSSGVMKPPPIPPAGVTGIPINPGDRLRFDIIDGTVNTIIVGEVGPEGGSRPPVTAPPGGAWPASGPPGAPSWASFWMTPSPPPTLDWDAPTALDFWNEPRSRNYPAVDPGGAAAFLRRRRLRAFPK